MSTVTPPVQLVAGVQTQLPQPQSGLYVGLVLSNLSAYVLTVNIMGRLAYLQPFTAMSYSIAQAPGSPVQVTPALPLGATVVAGQAEQVQAEWYQDGEPPPDGTYPLSLTANAIQAALEANASVQLTYSETVILANGTAFGSGVFVGPIDVSQYASVILVLNAVAGITQVQTIWDTGASDYLGVAYDGANQQAGVWQIPVQGATLILHNIAATTTIALIGTNRTVPRIAPTLLGQTTRALSFNGGVAAGSSTELHGGDGLVSPYTSTVGQAFVTMFTSLAGFFYISYVLPNGTLGQIQLEALAINARVQEMMATPPGYVTWGFRATAAGALSAGVQVVQA